MMTPKARSGREVGRESKDLEDCRMEADMGEEVEVEGIILEVTKDKGMGREGRSGRGPREVGELKSGGGRL